MSVYLDTSALAKLYVSEPGSEAFATYLGKCEDPCTSSLVVTEMCSLLVRHRRLGAFDARYLDDALALLRADVEEGRLSMHPLRDRDVRAAGFLITRLDPVPLRSLDALHLAVCEARGIRQLATADRRMAAAAPLLGMQVTEF